MTRARLYVVHILECIERVERYTAGGKKEFISDTKTQDAVIRNIQVLAESVRLLPDTIKDRYPDIPWRLIAGIRNVLLHQYLSVNLETVWQVVERDLPNFQQRIATILTELGDED